MTDATYSVKPSSSEAPSADVVSARAARAPGERAPSGTAAVYVVHGIGGQLQFQTLTETADGLRDASLRLGGTPSGIAARAVGVGGDRLQRMELTLSNGTSTRTVHVYEGYWAPITEGEVTLRDVIRFLFKAGIDGLWHSALPFKRFLDQQCVSFPVPVRTPLFLLTALLVTLSLVVMNASILALAALRTPLMSAPAWASAPLFRDVTALLDLFVVAAVAFGAALVVPIAWGAWLRSAGARVWRTRSARASTIVAAVTLILGSPSIVSFVLLLTATVAAGVALPQVIYFHAIRAQSLLPPVSLLDQSFPAADVDGLLRGASVLLIVLTGVALAIAVGLAVFRILRGLAGSLQAKGSGQALGTAFLFAIQGSNREGREALAASIQPLIGFPSKRPRWVNVYSGWDLISGSLDFYDKGSQGPGHIENQSDPEACVWLAAHTQYWYGQLVFDTIHQHLVP